MPTSVGAVELGAQWVHGGSNPAQPIASLAAAHGLSLLPADQNAAQAYYYGNFSLVPAAVQADWDADYARFVAFWKRADAGDYGAPGGGAKPGVSLAAAVAAFGPLPAAAAGLAAVLGAEVEQEYGASASELEAAQYAYDGAYKGTDMVMLSADRQRGYSQVASVLSAGLTDLRLSSPVSHARRPAPPPPNPPALPQRRRPRLLPTLPRSLVRPSRPSDPTHAGKLLFRPGRRRRGLHHRLRRRGLPHRAGRCRHAAPGLPEAPRRSAVQPAAAGPGGRRRFRPRHGHAGQGGPHLRLRLLAPILGVG